MWRNLLPAWVAKRSMKYSTRRGNVASIAHGGEAAARGGRCERGGIIALALNETILGVIALTRTETQSHGVSPEAATAERVFDPPCAWIMDRLIASPIGAPVELLCEDRVNRGREWLGDDYRLRSSRRQARPGGRVLFLTRLGEPYPTTDP